MAQLTIDTRLDADLKERFNAGDMEPSVVDQIIRVLGGHENDAALDADLKPLYAVDSRGFGYKRLAVLLQTLRIVRAAKAPPAVVATATPEEPKIVAAADPPPAPPATSTPAGT